MAKILLVEDSATQAVEMTMLLEAAEHDVMHVSNGALGMDALRDQSPDVVITDLEMPEVNGLELVQQMRVDFSHVPSILVTSHGSEDLAAEALRCGAAAYVPKHRLSELLNDTIIDVLGVIRTDASYEKLISTLRENVFAFELPNDPDLITPLVGLLMQVCSGMELLSSVDAVRLGVAIEHSVANAMCHGNLELDATDCPSHCELVRDGVRGDLLSQRLIEEPYRSRRVHVRAQATMSEIRVDVTDEGSGFDTSIVPKEGQFEPQRLLADEDFPQGSGLVLMSSFVDELTFNDVGNSVTLVKRVG
ncbi:MAG: response regulator [Planctomycetota bacterium]